MCYLLASRDRAISWSSGGSHKSPGRAIMDQRRDPGPLKAPDTTGVGHDCDDNGEAVSYTHLTLPTIYSV